jgi:hypothetical protein
VVLANNTLVGNFDVQPPRTLSGGAIYGVATTNYIVANNVVAWNSSGMRLISAPKPPTQFCNNCVYGNLTNYMPATANFNGLYGNVSVDPLLVGTNGYHLQTNSPCIDAGNDAYTGAALLDLDGEPRILGAHADIGADEVVPPGAWQPLPVTTNTVQASIFTMGGITYARYAVILANAGQRLNGKGAVSQAARTFTLRVPLEQLVVTNACPSLVTTRNGLLVLGALTPGDYVLNISSTENENLPVPFAVSADTGRTLELSRNTATGGVRLEVNGITGWSYIIQVSPDLLEWTDLTATGAGSLELPANSFGSDAKRFFRAKIQP